MPSDAPPAELIPPPPPAAAPGPPAKRRLLVVLVVVGAVLGTMIVAALIVQATILKSFYIPSAAMSPTLRPGDRILVHRGTDRGDDIRRGDIVVFSTPPGQPTQTHDLIKRVVGVPGDTVTIDGDHVLVDGEVLDEPYLPPGTVTAAVGPHGCAPADPCVIGDHEAFVLGDNRTNSADSRSFGPIQQSTIVGQAVFQTWPLGRLRAL